jgi:hypothetical protein
MRSGKNVFILKPGGYVRRQKSELELVRHQPREKISNQETVAQQEL